MRRLLSRDLGVLAGLYTVAFGARFVAERDGTLHWEELLQPTASMLFLQDPSHVSLLRLQYRTFCGGCTAESLLFLPLAWLTDASLVAWKLIPLAFGLAVLALLHALARRAAGRMSGLAAGVAFLLAPSFYQHNRMVAWGNHFEAAVFVLAMLWLWLRWLEQDEKVTAAAIGLVAGLGFWFCYGTAITLPLLALLALVAAPRRALVRVPLVLGGLVVGLLPWLYSQSALRSMGRISADQSWLSLYGGGLGDNLVSLQLLPTRLSDLAGPNFWKVSMHPGLGDAAVVVGFMGWLALVVGVAGALVLGFRGCRRDGIRGVPALALASSVFCLAYLVLNLALLPNWLEHGVYMTRQSLRYSSLAVPLQLLCLGILAAWLWGRGRGARIAAALLVGAVCLGGLTDTALTLREGYASTRPLRITAARLQHLQCGWIPTIEDAGEPEPAAWLHEVLERAPDAALPRRADLFRAGHGLGWGATRGRAAEWGAAIRELPTADREALLGGVACIIWAQRSGSDLGWKPLGGPMSSMDPLLDALGDDAGADLSSWLVSFMAAYHSHAGNSLLDVHPSQIDPGRYAESPGYAAGLARHVGVMHGAAYEGSLPSLLASSGDWDPEIRRAYAQGLGCKLGELWGHDPGWLVPAMEQIDARDREEIELGSERCVERYYHWR